MDRMMFPSPKTVRWTSLVAMMAILWAPAAAKDQILVLRPAGINFEETINGLSDSLEDLRISLHQVVMQKPLSVEELAQQMDKYTPNLLVLMDNPTIELYRNYQITYHGKREFPPAIAVMAAFVDQFIHGLENTTGISYEVPALVSFQNLRDLLETPLSKVGVIYREPLKNYIAQQKELCLIEEIQLIPFELPSTSANLKRPIKRGLRHLLQKEDVDAIWVLNDASILQPSVVEDVWWPMLRRAKIPVIVGVERLIDTYKFGNFAILPDHYALGTQLADTALEIRDNGWKMESEEVGLPLSVKKLLNLDFARKNLKLKKGSLAKIDRIVD